MENKRLYYALSWSIIPVIYMALFFLLVNTEKDSASWISLVFVMISLVVIPFVVLFMKTKEKGYKLLDYTLYRLVVIYIVVEILLSLFFLLLLPQHPKLSFSIQLLILGVFLFVLFINKGANIATQESVRNQKDNARNIRDWRLILNLMMNECKDIEILKQMDEIADLINSSPNGNEQFLLNIDNRITNLLTDLSNNHTLNKEMALDLCFQIKNCLKKRIIILKSSNYA